MTTTIQYHVGRCFFYFQHGNTTRLLSMIQLWNLGISERQMRLAMLSPETVIVVRSN